MTPFERAWAFISHEEGGARITDDPDDPGGLTKWGISQRSFPSIDIRNLTEDGAKALFRSHYWARAKCDSFPAAVAIAVVDSGYNQGVRTAVSLLQEALRVEPDGIVGPNTIAAVNRKPPNEVVNEFLSRRALRYADGKAKFRRGWFMRLFKLKDALSAV